MTHYREQLRNAVGADLGPVWPNSNIYHHRVNPYQSTPAANIRTPAEEATAKGTEMDHRSNQEWMMVTLEIEIAVKQRDNYVGALDDLAGNAQKAVFTKGSNLRALGKVYKLGWVVEESKETDKPVTLGTLLLGVEVELVKNDPETIIVQ